MSYKITAIGPICTLGEGPLWHPQRKRLFWFDIPRGKLHSSNPFGDQKRSWDFGEAASAMGWIDRQTLLVATASGLQKLNLFTGRWETLVEVETDNPNTQSNDGRAGPGGHFWFGTVGTKLEKNAGSYYLYANGRLEKLFDGVSVPNSTCFSPDGKTAYLGDTVAQIVWRWELDKHGLPTGDKQVHLDFTETTIYPDGSVCDQEGYLWNAQWDSSRIARYAPNGKLDRTISLPVTRPTCPAFGGPDLNWLYVTTATMGLSETELSKQPNAGRVLSIKLDVVGIPEFPVVI